jgi:hypothetical protein
VEVALTPNLNCPPRVRLASRQLPTLLQTAVVKKQGRKTTKRETMDNDTDEHENPQPF